MKKFIYFILILTLNLSAGEKTKLKDLEFLNDQNNERIKITFDGDVTSQPLMTFRKNMLQLEFSNALVWPKIEKKFTFGSSKYDLTMMAYQFDQNIVRFRAFFPYSVEEKENKFTITKDRENLYLEIPSRIPEVKKESSNNKINDLDEKYLAKLLIEKGDVKPIANPIEDKIKVVQSSVEKKSDNYSLAPFIGKFAGFLTLVLLIFFALATVFKKVIQGKGNKGFLNGLNTVEVLSTTYIGPKKNLLLVKVYKQILLLGVSDSGVNFLTEINEPNDLLKNGEDHLTGTNFDKSLNNANSQNKDFLLKKDDENTLMTQVKDGNSEKKKEKITDQIKKKIQQLKPLQ